MRESAKRALELDPTLAEGWAAVAGIKFEDWDWQGTIDAYEKAFELNPESIEVWVLQRMHWRRSASSTRRRVSSNTPSAPIHWPLTCGSTTDSCSTSCEDMRSRSASCGVRWSWNQRNGAAPIILAYLYLDLNRVQDALASLDRPEFQSASPLGVVYAHARASRGRTESARTAGPTTNPIGVAEIYFALGDRDKGFKWLSKAIDQRQGFARWLNVSPLYDEFRMDPRFAPLSWPASSSRLRTLPRLIFSHSSSRRLISFSNPRSVGW